MRGKFVFLSVGRYDPTRKDGNDYGAWGNCMVFDLDAKPVHTDFMGGVPVVTATADPEFVSEILKTGMLPCVCDCGFTLASVATERGKKAGIKFTDFHGVVSSLVYKSVSESVADSEPAGASGPAEDSESDASF
jgi:hypothetical protein